MAIVGASLLYHMQLPVYGNIACGIVITLTDSQRVEVVNAVHTVSVDDGADSLVVGFGFF